MPKNNFGFEQYIQIEEIYFNLLLEEKDLKIKPIYGYFTNQKDINEKMRAILVDWIVQVHYNLKCKIETLYLTIWIIDTYLSNKKIQRSQLQLLGIASLLISCKINEICYPNILNFVKLTDYAFQKIELSYY